MAVLSNDNKIAISALITAGIKAAAIAKQLNRSQI
jgi:IS30 family transposase